jgi:nitroreductase
VKPVGATEVRVADDEPIVEVMRTMRAMRRLKTDPVPHELLDRLIEAATWAPSASNVQAYSFVVVTDRGQIARLAEPWRACFEFHSRIGVRPDGMSAERYQRMTAAARYQAEHFYEIPALIIPCYDLSGWQHQVQRNVFTVVGALRRLGPRRAFRLARNATRLTAMSEAASVYPGVENLLLAARAAGLGAVITTWHLTLEAEFKAILGLPRRVKTFAIIPVGYPIGNFGPVQRRSGGDIVHHDSW